MPFAFAQHSQDAKTPGTYSKFPMKTATLSATRSILQKLNVHPEKTLGQNFLIDGNILNIIINTANMNAHDEILEIGPGLGVLTEVMAEYARRLVCVEKDPRLYAWLKSTYQNTGNIQLICADILKLDQEALIQSGLNKIVSNLPYSTGSAILVNFFKANKLPEQITVTIQHEVAKRMLATHGKPDFGLLSLWSQLNYKIRIQKVISPTCFYPAPQVKSALVQLTRIYSPALTLISRKFFFELTKLAFSCRRKQIKNVFGRIPEAWNLSLDQIIATMNELGINLHSRPEMLSINTWVSLANALYRKVKR